MFLHFVPLHRLPTYGSSGQCFGKLCRHPEPCFVKLPCSIGAPKRPFKCLWPLVCRYILATLCTSIFGVGFCIILMALCVYLPSSVYGFIQIFNVVNPLPFSLSPPCFIFAVRSSRRTTIRESISQCGNNAPRS